MSKDELFLVAILAGCLILLGLTINTVNENTVLRKTTKVQTVVCGCSDTAKCDTTNSVEFKP